MPGIFGIPTPEEIRARIGKTSDERSLSLGALPTGGPQVVAANQIGSALGGLLRSGYNAVGKGGVIPGVSYNTDDNTEEARIKAIQDSIKTEADALNINMKDNPVEFATLQAKILASAGETEVALKNISFASQMDKILNMDQTALTTVVRQRFGLGPSDKIGPLNKNDTSSPNYKAGEWLEELQNVQAKSGVLGLTPDKPQATNVGITKANISLTDELGKEDFVVNEESYSFDEIENSARMAVWVADRVEELQALNKRRNAPPLSANDATRQAIEEAKTGLVEVDQKGVAGFFATDVRFEPSEVRSGTTKEDEPSPEGTVKFQNRK